MMTSDRKAKMAARKALDLDPELGEAMGSLAHVRLHDWDWEGLEKDFQRAIELNPVNGIVYYWYGELLMSLGRPDEAIAVTQNGRRRWGRSADGGSGPQRIMAPMPGKVVRVLVKAGEAVQARQPLIVVEAMKMENELRAAHPGTVTQVAVGEGTKVEGGTLLIVIRSQ